MRTISLLKKNQQKKMKLSTQKGFTLIELLVTITIFVILTGVVLVHQNSFDNTILLNNLAYDTALTVRQAQTYGVNSQEISVGNFASSTGVAFNTAVSNTSFILFVDTVGANGSPVPDGLYDGNFNTCQVGDPECLQRYSIKNGSFISALCVGSDAVDCTAVSNLTVLFTRPDPDAQIFTVDAGGTKSATSTYAQITVSSAGNAASKNVIVTATGQIYVQ